MITKKARMTKNTRLAIVGVIIVSTIAVVAVVATLPKAKGTWICGGSFIGTDDQVHSICGYTGDQGHYYDCIVTQDSKGDLHYTNCVVHDQPTHP